MTDAFDEGRQSADNPFGITKEMVTRLSAQIREKRAEFLKKRGYSATSPTRALGKIPHYDWTEDPIQYKVEDDYGEMVIPPERCIHCGSRFVHIKPSDPFCGPCHIAMLIGGEESLLGFPGRKKIKSKIRIPDGVDEVVYRKQLEDGSKVEFKTGIQVAKDG